MRAILFIAASFVALAVGPCQAQTGICGASYACISTYYYVTCSGNTYNAQSATTPCPAGTTCLAGTTSTLPGDMCVTISPAPTCPSVGYFRVPGRCRDYYFCESSGGSLSVARYAECAKGDFEFSSTLGYCVPTSQANCTIISTPTNQKPKCSPFAKEIDNSSCSSYFSCNFNGERQKKQCPPLMVFDSTLRICTFFTDCGTRPR